MSTNMKLNSKARSQHKMPNILFGSSLVVLVAFLVWMFDGSDQSLLAKSKIAQQLNEIGPVAEKPTVDANDLAKVGVQATFDTEPSEVDSNDDVEANYFSAMGEIGFYVPGTANYEDAWCEQWELNDEAKARATAEFTEFLDRNGEGICLV